MMRVRYNQQLEMLHLELIKMGALCEDAIAAAMKALFSGDHSMITKTIDMEKQIDEKERVIEALCMKLLLQQQPVARDLRMISSALKMISDMERIGDQALDIAEISEFIKPEHVVGKAYLQQMSDKVSDMVTESIESFVKEDMELAKKVILNDNEVDLLFDKVKEDLVDQIVADRASGEFCLDLMMVTKYLERIGDHAVNIAEWVIFSITGSHVGPYKM